MSETLKEVINRILFEEEACIGQTGKSKINVYGGEGKFPHLHYEIDGVKGCIRLDIPRYFCHESFHEGLNSSQRRKMIEWLKANWARCVEQWNKDSKQDKVNCPMPDYNLLPKLGINGKLAKEDRK